MGYYEYQAEIVNWIDGDTVELEVDLGFKMKMRDRFRLYGVNTPELRPKKSDFKTEEEREAHKKKALEAKAYVEGLAPVGWVVKITTHKDAKGKYGRWLVDVHITSTITLRQALINQGLGIPYMDDTNGE